MPSYPAARPRSSPRATSARCRSSRRPTCWSSSRTNVAPRNVRSHAACMRSGMAGGPISPPAVTRWKHEFLPAYLSNGLIGARVGRFPMLEGLVIVSGLAAVHPKEKVEGFARGPYPFAGDVAIDGVKISERSDQLKLVAQRYDFSCGELHTKLRFVAGNANATIEVLT